MNRLIRGTLLVLVDAAMINIALFAALWLRFDGNIPGFYMNNAVMITPLATIVFLASFYSFRLYKRLWQYASIGELLAIVYASTVGISIVIAIAYFWMVPGVFPLPRTVFVLWALLVVALIGASRLSWRFYREYRFPHLRNNGGQAVLIVGAGDAGAMVARELQSRSGLNDPDSNLVPVGFVDDDLQKQGKQLYNLPVIGTREDIPRLVDKYNVAEIIIAMPSVKGKVVREIVEICQETEARLKIVPGMYDLLEGKIKVDPIREVRIEDILGREPVQVDLDAIAGYLHNEVVLVTGAGGSIGSELCRQVSRFAPGALVLLGHDENGIYEIHQELMEADPELDLVQAVVSVTDEAAVEQVFRKHRPAVVFHAAAHKHVPLMEYNPAEALKNNVLGTRVVARAADKYGSKAFIFVSTDKAVNPTSVMGASKRVAEMVIQEMARQSKTRFAAVRFGNVLGSRGSVVPLFQRQIAAGGPVTVTHPEMVRYFMTIPEAVQLVIQAGALTKGGEIFVLDMGEPVKILDLARSMIILSGYEPDEDIEIVYTGIRPGEKLYEEILTSGEGVNSTSHERIFIAKPEEFDEIQLERIIYTIARPGWRAEMKEVEEVLRLVIPRFRAVKSKEYQVM